MKPIARYPVCYPPILDPGRDARALAFVRSVNAYFRVSRADTGVLWEHGLDITRRLLATSWRHVRPKPHHAPMRFVLPVVSKPAAKAMLRAMHRVFDRYGVPRETRREYLKDLFIVAVGGVHRIIAQLQRGELPHDAPLH